MHKVIRCVVGGIKNTCGVEEGSRPILTITPELEKVINISRLKEFQAKVKFDQNSKFKISSCKYMGKK